MTTSQKSKNNRYTNLVSWLRISAAGSLDPHVGQAADAIEHLMSEIDFLDEHWRMNKKRIAELESALLKLSQSVEMAQNIDCISGWDFALTLPFARKVLGKNK